MSRIGIIIYLFLFSFLVVQGQEVILSEEFNLKNDFFYDVHANIEDRIFLYRDKGFKHEIHILNEDLQLVDSRELEFEKRKIDVFGMCSFENEFQLIYAYKNKGDQIIKLNRYDKNAYIISEDTILLRDYPIISSRSKFALSEDKSQILLFKIEYDDKMEIISYDLDGKKMNWKERYDFKDSGTRRDFRKIIINNQGKVYAFIERNNNRMRRKKHAIEVYEFNGSNEPVVSKLDFIENLSEDFEAEYDEKHHKIVIGGLYGNGPESLSEGYYFSRFTMSTSSPLITFTAIDDSFLESIETSGMFKRKKGLDHFLVRELLLRNDGGVLLMTEMSKELARRSTYSGRGGPAIRYVDFYNEDMAIIALFPDGSEHWKTVLHKKQFSQDDEAIYSSFFTFATPSNLRIVYNDEVRNENTVSEYIMNPLGEIERKNVLNTQYQRLKLRFQKAIQLSSTSYLVPSERGNRVVIVRINYDTNL